MKLSIIVPVHNTEKYLSECVNSLINQSYQDKEIILIDNGSTDESGKMCDEFAHNNDCVITIHQENRKVYGARNRGLEVATGDYIALVDSDDGMDRDAYEIMIRELEKYKADIVSCGYITDYGEQLNIKDKNRVGYKTYQAFGKEQCQKSVYSGEGFAMTGFVWNKVFKREVIESLKFNENLEIIDDLFFVLESASNADKLCYIDLPLYHYRYVQGGATQKPNIPRLLRCLESYKYVIKWAEKKAKPCITAIHHDYIFWNTKTAEMMLNAYDEKAYLTIKANLSQEKGYIKTCKFRIRILANALLHSWKKYKMVGTAVWKAKCLYRKVKK